MKISSLVATIIAFAGGVILAGGLIYAVAKKSQPAPENQEEPDPETPEPDPETPEPETEP